MEVPNYKYTLQQIINSEKQTYDLFLKNTLNMLIQRSVNILIK